MQFLSLLEIHPLLSRESLVLILQHEADNPKIVAACWNQLLSRYNSPGGFSLSETMDLIFEAIQQNHLFPRDAAALLSVRFSDVVPYLLHTNSSLKVALLAFLLPYAASPEEEIAKMDSTLIASISDFNVGSNMHSLILSTLVQRNDCVGVQLALRDYLEQAVDLCTTINILNVNKTFSSKILHSLKPEPSLAVLLSTLEELVTSEVLKE
jgi:hypothetical protein